MTKRKTTKAAKALSPILDNLHNKTGYFPPAKLYFNHNPAAFIQSIFEDSEEVLVQRLLAMDRAGQELLESLPLPIDFKWETEQEDGTSELLNERVALRRPGRNISPEEA